MTAAAVAAIAPGSARDLRRCKAGDAADTDSAPFASLLGSEPAGAAPAKSPEKSAAKDEPEDPEARDATDPADGAAVLPAWLLALREPPPPATAGDPLTADGAITDGGLLAGAVAGSGFGSGLGAGMSLDELRALKGAPGTTPPTQTPPLPTVAEADAAAAADTPIGDGALALPSTVATGFTSEPSLDAQQSVALDAALAQVDAGSAATSQPVAIAGDRAASPALASAPAATDPAAGTPNNPLGGGLANAVDAFGEPLSLQGQDAALRLGERLRWLRDSGVQEARLQLHPRELGSVDIRIRIEGQGASVWFGADHPGARAALEASLPQLRDRLAGEGLQLAQASVGSQTPDPGTGQPQGERGRSAPWAGFGNGGDDAAAARSSAGSQPAVAGLAQRLGRGLIDRYA
ncbi:MAG: flagellar hook-length control protein FliK [Nevskia sp.]|uniref:flagellar hook-length control protein FliK n=1 Tax=Nevskia sp. TaxID=1929292 RepID=UPI0040368326